MCQMCYDYDERYNYCNISKCMIVKCNKCGFKLGSQDEGEILYNFERDFSSIGEKELERLLNKLDNEYYNHLRLCDSDEEEEIYQDYCIECNNKFYSK